MDIKQAKVEMMNTITKLTIEQLCEVYEGVYAKMALENNHDVILELIEDALFENNEEAFIEWSNGDTAKPKQYFIK